MARIRTVKPEFFQDEKLAPMSVIDRFVFLGLISMADDAGRLLDNVKIIDAYIFPETSETCRGSLDELSANGRIRRGKTASGQRVIQITNWDSHQRIEKPNLRGALPCLVSESHDYHQVVSVPGNIGETSGNDHRRVTEESQNHTNDQRPTTYDRRPTTVGPSQPPIDPVASVYREQEGELRAAGLPHENLALDLLMRQSPHPFMIVLELHSFASGMKVIRGEHTGRLADAADVMRAIAEMAANGAPWSTKLFRGYLRRIADRKPEPASAEDREAAKLAAELTRQAETAKIVGVIRDDRSEEEKAEAARLRAEAMAKFKAMYRGHNPNEAAA